MNFSKFFKIVLPVLIICIVISAGVILSKYVFGDFGTGNLDGIEPIVDDRVNILVMGTDESGLRTDTIMIFSCDTKNRTMNILSIPRDTRVMIGNSYMKINAAYGIGKDEKSRTERAIKIMRQVSTLPIHFYAVVQPKGFRQVIDILGGVKLTVPKRMHYYDPDQNLLIDLYPGEQVLDGKKAEQFVRYRSYPTGDLGRIEAQQRFIKAITDQKLKLEYITKAPKLFEEMSKYIKTNIGLGDVPKLLPVIKLMKPESVTTYELPGYPETIQGISYYIYDVKKTQEMIDSKFLYK